MMDVFFNGRPAQRAKEQYEWILVTERQHRGSDHPNFPHPLFSQWTENGWEVVSVAPKIDEFPPVAVGVLKKLRK